MKQTARIDNRAPVAGLGGIRPSTINGLIAGAIIVLGLYIGKPVLVPIAMAVLLAFVLAPIVLALRRARIPHGLAVSVVVAAAVASLVGLGAVLTAQISQLAADLPRYETELRDKVHDLRGAAISSPAMERAAETLKELKAELEKPADASEAAGAAPAKDKTSAQGSPEQRPIPVEVHYPEPKPLDSLISVVTTLIEPVATFAIVVVFVFFILLQRQDLRDRVIRLVGASDFQRTTAAMNDAGTRLSRYLFTLTILNLAFGVVIAAALWLIGIPAPVLWGIVAALMRFVPFIGSFIAAAFPIILAAAIDPGWTTLWLTIALFVTAEVAMSQFVEPLVQGQTTGLSPVAVLASAAFWTMLWGPIGLLLAVPLTVCLVVLGQHVDSLTFLHVMLGDEPALSPSERFYQRILAGDSNEVSEQGEDYIRKRSLSAFYEDVAIEALRMAQTDADRGLLSDDHLASIGATLDHMVDNLWDFDDVEAKPTTMESATASDTPNETDARAEAGHETPSGAGHLPVLKPEALADPWRNGAPVLCVPARSVLDRAASELLAHVLARHGIDAEVLGPERLSSVELRKLNDKKACAVCICSLSAHDRALPTRFLARRLRRVWPSARIVAVVWAADADERDRILETEAYSIDAVATTIAGAVEQVVETASCATTTHQDTNDDVMNADSRIDTLGSHAAVHPHRERAAS